MTIQIKMKILFRALSVLFVCPVYCGYGSGFGSGILLASTTSILGTVLASTVLIDSDFDSSYGSGFDSGYGFGSDTRSGLSTGGLYDSDELCRSCYDSSTIGCSCNPLCMEFENCSSNICQVCQLIPSYSDLTGDDFADWYLYLPNSNDYEVGICNFTWCEDESVYLPWCDVQDPSNIFRCNDFIWWKRMWWDHCLGSGSSSGSGPAPSPELWGSCYDSCGGISQVGDCYCDDYCHENFECCTDYWGQCSTDGTVSGICNMSEGDTPCYCEPGCLDRKDCCGWYWGECGANNETTPYPNPQHMIPVGLPTLAHSPQGETYVTAIFITFSDVFSRETLEAMAGVVCVHCLYLPADRCAYIDPWEDERRRVTYTYRLEATTYSAVEANTVETLCEDEETFINNAYVGMQMEEELLGLSSLPTITALESETTVMTENPNRKTGSVFPWLIILCVCGGIILVCLLTFYIMKIMIHNEEKKVAMSYQIKMMEPLPHSL